MIANLISSISVKGLFGLYDYVLPDGAAFPEVAILYGDNGVGKSSLLRLTFDLLSSAGDRGHRTRLYDGHFTSLIVSLASGEKISAIFKTEKNLKFLELSIEILGRKVAIWDYKPNAQETDGYMLYFEEAGGVIKRAIPKDKNALSIPKGETAYLKALSKVVPTTFLLNAERRLDSDSVADPSDEVELRRLMNYKEPKRVHDLVVRAREVALSQALSSAFRWLGQKAVIGTNRGSMNVNSVYTNILSHLLARKDNEDQIDLNVSADDLTFRFKQIGLRTKKHTVYELATDLDTSSFIDALDTDSHHSKDLVAGLLQPYVQSLESRLDAVEPIYRLVDRFVNVINNLLSDKRISFKLSEGFQIHNSLGIRLLPPQLSSGEQQLLLLFCYVLMARDNPSVFMIDEPEISLNIKWQRQLIDLLLSITENANIQFIFASHSMELLAQHSDNVVELVNRRQN